MNPTAEQIKALQDYASVHGRNWKSALNHAWMTCGYSPSDNSSVLQGIRNTLGPSWLVRFRLPKNLASLELSNGEGGRVEIMSALLSFMNRENHPVPRTADQLDRLLTRYMIQWRYEQMRYVDALRVQRGESPLPKRLTGGEDRMK